jgi:hypothetical protein
VVFFAARKDDNKECVQDNSVQGNFLRSNVAHHACR